MPSTLADLLSLLDLERIEDNLYRGRQPDTRMQRVFGGQVAGQALSAGIRTVPEGRSVHGLHAVFLHPGDTSVPIVYDVTVVRDGRSFSTRRVVARQRGREIFYLTASFQVPEDGFEHQLQAPDAPDPDDCEPLSAMIARWTGRPAEAWEREWAALDMRYVAGTRTEGADDPRPARSRLWFRAAGELPDDPAVHACVLTYASDLTLLGGTLVPHGLVIGDPRVQAASLDHTIWFHRDVRMDEWLLYDQVSPSASGGRGLALGSVFRQDGTLVATVAQEGLIRPREV